MYFLETKQWDSQQQSWRANVNEIIEGDTNAQKYWKVTFSGKPSMLRKISTPPNLQHFTSLFPNVCFTFSPWYLMLTSMLCILLFAFCLLTVTHRKCKFFEDIQFCSFWSPLYRWHQKECLVHSSFSTNICWKNEGVTDDNSAQDLATAYFTLA